MAYSALITELDPTIALDRANYGDQYDKKIDFLRKVVKLAFDGLEANSGGGGSSVMDSNGVPTATTGKGYIEGTGNEGLVLQLFVAAMAVRVTTAGVAYNNLGARIVIPTSTSLAIAAADATNPRKDIVVVTAAGALKVYTGTPAGSPADPTLSAGDVPLARVNVAANATTILTANIDDLRSRTVVSGSKINDASVTAAKLIVFESAVQTGTGANQPIAHGKGLLPTYVTWSPTDTNGVALPHTYATGTHTTTNVVMNVTSGLKYKVTAFF